MGAGEPTCALFIDGPLKGTSQEVDPHARSFGFVLPPRPGRASRPGWYTQTEPVHYHFMLTPVFNRVVLIGYSKPTPAGDDLFNALISRAARAVAVL